MKTEVFRRLSDLIYRTSGIVLPEEKAVLLSNRVQKRLRALGIDDPSEYLRIIELDIDGDELSRLIDVVSTNVTFFYREPRHFEIYGEQLRKLSKSGRRDLRIWCAAASSGEEPYTLAIETVEQLGSAASAVRILATDICTTVLKRAIARVYREKAVDKMPGDRKSRYFELFEHDDDERYFKVRDEAARLVLFKKLNLVQFPYPVQGPFDMIFCRNVMIYFDSPTRAKIISAFQQLLRPGGLLFLSHSENLLGIDHELKRFDSSVFQKA